MADSEKEALIENLSRKSSASSSTGSSFEKVEQSDSGENSVEVKEDDVEKEESAKEDKTSDELSDEENQTTSEKIDEEIDEEEKVVDPLDAPMKPEQKQFYTDSDKFRAIRLLILFSAAMFTLPLLVMFSMYYYVFIDHYHLPPDQAMLYAGLCGISVVFIIVIMFVYIAYKEEVDAEERLKKKE